jgi:hypothetical protein
MRPVASTGHTRAPHIAYSAGRTGLCYQILIRPQLREPVDHAVHRDEMERHDQLTTPACSTGDEQDHDIESPPL